MRSRLARQRRQSENATEVGRGRISATRAASIDVHGLSRLTDRRLVQQRWGSLIIACEYAAQGGAYGVLRPFPVAVRRMREQLRRQVDTRQTVSQRHGRVAIREEAVDGE
eukprot:3051401-Prymnesium_polylepis.1